MSPRATEHRCPNCGRRLFRRPEPGFGLSGIATGGPIPLATGDYYHECPKCDDPHFSEDELREAGTWAEANDWEPGFRGTEEPQ